MAASVKVGNVVFDRHSVVAVFPERGVDDGENRGYTVHLGSANPCSVTIAKNETEFKAVEAWIEAGMPYAESGVYDVVQHHSAPEGCPVYDRAANIAAHNKYHAKEKANAEASKLFRAAVNENSGVYNHVACCGEDFIQTGGVIGILRDCNVASPEDIAATRAALAAIAAHLMALAEAYVNASGELKTISDRTKA